MLQTYPRQIMRAQLTCSVFRCLVSNHGFPFHCPQRIAQRTRFLSACRSMLRYPPQRSIFGFSLKPKEESRGPDIAPGFQGFIELNKALHLKHRPASPENVAIDMRAFIKYKTQLSQSLTDIECTQVLGALKYLQANKKGGKDLSLSPIELWSLLQRLDELPKEDKNAHRDLARAVWDEIVLSLSSTLFSDQLPTYCSILIRVGSTAEVQSLVEKLEELDSAPPAESRAGTIGQVLARDHSRVKLDMLWKLVVQGYSTEDNEQGFLEALKHIKDVDFHCDRCVMFYANRNHIERSKFWYDKLVEHDGRPSAVLLQILLRFANRNDEQSWCKDVFRRVINTSQSPLSKAHWNVVLEWAASSLTKGIEQVEQIMAVMAKQRGTTGGDTCGPDSESINQLVSYAASINNSYLAERFISLGIKKGIQPDVETMILQIDYRTSAGDLSGAHEAYMALQTEQVVNGIDLHAVNRYLRALCASPTASYDRILSIISDLSDRGLRLEASTVSVLIRLYLQRNQLDDIISILHAHVFYFNSKERSGVIPVFLSHILDPATDTDVSWDTYNILRTFFSEMCISRRTNIMNEFFRRGRPDMAIHTFGHMRGHDLPEFRPTVEIYVTAFAGLAAFSDADNLDILHNMLKLDVNIDPCTSLYNALMLAYNAVGRPERALAFWDDITNSGEGPSYRSLEIVFLVCAKKQFGFVRAQEIWGSMLKMEIELTPQVFAQYVGCLAGNVRLAEASRLINALDEGKLVMCGFKLNAEILGTAYNMLPSSVHQQDFEHWSKSYHSQLWAELEKFPSKPVVTRLLDELQIYDLGYKLKP